VSEQNPDACAVCVNDKGNAIHRASEKMFGTDGEFEYLECARCGSLQLRTIPRDLSRYYPAEYYAFGQARPINGSALNTLLRRLRSEVVLRGGSRLARLTVRAARPPDWWGWLATRVTTRSVILDLGCGAGYLLLELQKQGFRNLIGADAFISGPIRYSSGITVYKELPKGLSAAFDFVLLNHSFEHMEDSESVLERLSQLLRPSGGVLIRMPVADSFAWRTYGTNWVQLDAPRHLVVHTNRSMEMLASRSGFRIVEVTYDSTAFQFWGSEQYCRGIALRDERSYAENPERSIFSSEQIREFDRRAEELNANGEGDQAAFLLRRLS
jgi:2-polyprenyl-3-methyl-5-hydroxy-6-metoxy-1,4-benzoquinol methylase